MSEEWKNIKGFEGKYQVSNIGRIRSCDRVVFCKGRLNIKGRVLRQQAANGYHIVGLKVNGKHTTKVVHHLVWDHFSNIDRSRLQIDHIDNDKSNNAFSNLQLLTARENTVKVTIDKGRIPGAYQTPNGKWISKIFINGKSKYLGTFDSQMAANEEYSKNLPLV